MICHYHNIKCRNIKDKGFVGTSKDVTVSCGNASPLSSVGVTALTRHIGCESL